MDRYFDDDVMKLIVNLNANEVQLADSAFQNPFDDNDGLTELNYLTVAYSSLVEDNDSEMFFSLKLRLNDQKVIRSRSVYTLLTLVSEVSGFADLIYVAIGFILGKLYTPRMIEATILKNMRPVDHQKKKQQKIVIDEPTTLDPLTVKRILIETGSKIKLRLGVWLTISQKFVPKRFRSHKANRLLELADKGLERVERALDVRSIVESQEDL